MTDEINWGPSGELVYNRTYSRTKPDGTKETWPETVARVVDGNLALAGGRHEWSDERDRLIELMTDFKILPAGRHLWASGVPGRQYLFNCHVSGWGFSPWDHFRFTFLRLMEGGGVGANYSNKYLTEYADLLGWGGSEEHGSKGSPFRVHIVCDPEHPDYQKMLEAGLISTEYDSEWAGSYEVEDSREGWADAMVDLIQTYYRDAENQNRVFDVSRVRAEGARLKTFGGRASGPLPLAVMLREVSDVLNARLGQPLDGLSAMAIDHSIAKCVVSGGNRRSARMAIMHWADPQVHEFIKIKQLTGEHWTTNISVEVDNEFWERAGESVDISTWGSDQAVTVKSDAGKVLEAISVGMLENGEPGFWNSDLSNVGEPNRVIATNPCGEIALEAWENCNLGHVNLAGFVREDGSTDEIGLSEAHRLMTRFLMRATYGDVNDPGQADVLARNRRIGVGHFGVASYLGLVGLRYSDAPHATSFVSMLGHLADVVDQESKTYAHSLRIPVPVKTRTVAPTGTIAKMPGVSEGIHPIFAKYFIRRIRISTIDPDQVALIDDYAAQGYHVEPCQYAPNTMVVSFPTKDSLLAEVEARYPINAEWIVQSAADLTLGEMLRMQELYQAVWADNAVSFTANIDTTLYTPDQVAQTLIAWGPSLKGATCFPETSMPQSPYERLTRDEFDALVFDRQLWQISDSLDPDCASGACPVK